MLACEVSRSLGKQCYSFNLKHSFEDEKDEKSGECQGILNFNLMPLFEGAFKDTKAKHLFITLLNFDKKDVAVVVKNQRVSANTKTVTVIDDTREMIIRKHENYLIIISSHQLEFGSDNDGWWRTYRLKLDPNDPKYLTTTTR